MGSKAVKTATPSPVPRGGAQVSYQMGASPPFKQACAHVCVCVHKHTHTSFKNTRTYFKKHTGSGSGQEGENRPYPVTSTDSSYRMECKGALLEDSGELGKKTRLQDPTKLVSPAWSLQVA